MTKIIRFQKEHVEKIKQQDRDLIEGRGLTEVHYEGLAAFPDSFSIEIDGRIVACCGLVEYWKGRGEVWAVIDRESGRYFVALFKAMKYIFANLKCKRIEVVVRLDYPQAHRLVQMLGFKIEAPIMENYSPAGYDCALYARVS